MIHEKSRLQGERPGALHGRRVRSAARALRAALLLCLLAGCAPQRWAMRIQAPEAPLGWPQGAPRVTYRGAITGFDPAGTGLREMARAAAFGKEADAGRLSNPSAVAVGPDGRLAVADLGGKCVHLYIPESGKYIRLTQAAKDLLFESPVGVAFDRRGHLFVTDSALGRLAAYSPEGKLLFSIDSAGGAQLRRPTGLAYNPARDVLYLAETLGHRVLVLSPEGRLLFSFGQRGSGPGEFNFPTHIAVDPRGERIAVTDAMNFRVQIFGHMGTFLASFGHHGDGSGDMAMPKGVALDENGVVYLVDALFDNIQLFDLDGRFLLTVGARGERDAEFWLPSGLFLDPRTKELYVCDTYNKRVQIFRLKGGER